MKKGRERVIQDLYGAAMGRVPWAKAFDRLCTHTDTRCITLDTYDMDAHAGEVLASNLAPHPAIEEYNRTFGQRNVLIETAYRKMRAGRAFRATRFVRMCDFEKTDLYNTVYRALGIRHVAGFALDANPRRVAQFSLIKPADGGDFSDADMQQLRELGPHLQQAWAGYSHLANLEASLTTLTRLWNRFDHAVMVLDPRMKLQFANRAAEALLAEGRCWYARNGYLKSCDSSCKASLGKAVQEILGGQQGFYSIAGPDSQQNGPNVTLYRLDDERVALLASDPNRSTADFRTGLQRCFGLTPTEAELVNALLAGESLRQFADLRRICYETARTHLKNAMAKNDWRRQSEMISSVLRSLLPPGLFRSDR